VMTKVSNRKMRGFCSGITERSFPKRQGMFLEVEHNKKINANNVLE